MAIDLNKEHYNTPQEPYTAPDGEIYPNGRQPVPEAYPQREAYTYGQAAARQEIYPDDREAYPNIQTVPDSSPDTAGTDIRTLPPQNNLPAEDIGKKTRKRRRIACLIFGAAVIAITGAVIAGAPLANMVGYDTEMMEFTAAGTNVISVRDSDIAVSIYRNEDNDNIQVLYQYNDPDEYTIGLSGGKLSISHSSTGIFDGRDSLTIFIPASYTGGLSVQTSNGSIYADEVYADYFSLQTTNASVNISNLETSGALEITTSNGHISAEGIKADADSCIFKTTNSRIEVDDCSFKSAKLTTSNGAVSMENTTFNEMNIKTSNGSITGELCGDKNDYTFDTSTSNGSNTLGTGGNGSIKLNCKTSNGKIDFDFGADLPDFEDLFDGLEEPGEEFDE